MRRPADEFPAYSHRLLILPTRPGLTDPQQHARQDASRSKVDDAASDSTSTLAHTNTFKEVHDYHFPPAILGEGIAACVAPTARKMMSTTTGGESSADGSASSRFFEVAELVQGVLPHLCRERLDLLALSLPPSAGTARKFFEANPDLYRQVANLRIRNDLSDRSLYKATLKWDPQQEHDYLRTCRLPSPQGSRFPWSI
ncbi:hypothetical protein V8E36_005284 [Tilletia maclaganii]